MDIFGSKEKVSLKSCHFYLSAKNEEHMGKGGGTVPATEKTAVKIY